MRYDCVPEYVSTCVYMFCYKYVIVHCLHECIKCADAKISVHVFFVYKRVNEYASVYEKGMDYMRLW